MVSFSIIERILGLAIPLEMLLGAKNIITKFTIPKQQSHSRTHIRKKTMGQIPNNFIIIKSIVINLVYVSWLKKISLFLFYSNTLFFSHKQQHFALSSLYSSPHTSLSWLFSYNQMAEQPQLNLFSLFFIFLCISSLTYLAPPFVHKVR